MHGIVYRGIYNFEAVLSFVFLNGWGEEKRTKFNESVDGVG